MKRMVTVKDIQAAIPHLYRHSIALKTSTCSLGLTFINGDPTEFDDVALIEELYNHDIISPINGAIKVGAGYVICSYAVFNEADNDFYVRGVSNSGNIETGSTKISLRSCLENPDYLVDDVEEIK